jgi:hypothetical protein
MAKIKMEEQDEILTFPVDSILELKIEEANVETVQGRNGPWEKVAFKFKVLGIQAIGDGSPVAAYENWITQNIYGSVPFRLTDSPENKLRIWAEAIFRQELGVGFELDTDMFVGRQVRGLTSQYESKSRDASGNPVKRHQIETLLPYGASTQPPAATPAPTQQAPAPAAAGAPAQDPWGANNWGSGDEPPF